MLTSVRGISVSVVTRVVILLLEDSKKDMYFRTYPSDVFIIRIISLLSARKRPSSTD